MARTLEQIKAEMQANNTLNLSTSAVAEWKLWQNIVAIAIWSFENIIESLKIQIDEALAKKQPGTLAWYANITKLFQTEGNLVVNDKGELGYDRIVIDKRIVSNVSVKETTEGVVSIKVAKTDGQGVLQPITSELSLLTQYLSSVKYAGTRIAVSSVSADVIKYTLIVYYDPTFNLVELQANVSQVIADYKKNLRFDGTFYSTDFIKSITAVKGVVTVKITTLQGKASAGSYATIDPFYELVSGYFNYDALSSLTYTAS